MSAYLLPLICAVFVWWFGTGAVLYVDGLPASAKRWTAAAASAIAGLAFIGVIWAADRTDVAAAYLGFVAGVALWGWNELLFLSGTVTGPNKSPRPADAKGVRRFILAAGTLIYHEFALVATAGAMLAASWDAPNQVAFWTFALLFAMRLSTKLNIFFGVPNLSEEMLPPGVDYLKSHFGPRRVTAFFAISVSFATLLVGWLVWAAADPGAGAFQHAAFSLLAALALLGFLEHWFLVLPLRETALWRWAMRAAEARSAREDRTGRTPVPGQRDVFERTGALNRAGGVATPPGNGRVQ
ncbi:MAG: putative photosynthetic complex assembly protein PuhE [Marivibrio sp.]|uniref:putative photosynthetic complex assembly protein PuhE n=1 Tax=Marivibrio sp. TaxID=2039719 RepID=UPI0032EF09BC